MSGKKYTLKFKTITCIDSSLSLHDCFHTIFGSENVIKHTFIDDRNNSHECRFEKFKLDSTYIYGRFGEIKESHAQNAVALVNDVECDDVNFKYHVQFLINFKMNELVFVFNNNASCFEEALIDFIAMRTNTFQVSLESIKTDDLKTKILKAKKIKFISLTQTNPEEYKSIFDSFFDDDVYETEIKLNLRRKRGVYREKIVDFIDKHKNDNQFVIAFTDEDGVEQIKHFAESLFFKAKKILIDTDDIANQEKMFSLLKDNLENYDKK